MCPEKNFPFMCPGVRVTWWWWYKLYVSMSESAAARPASRRPLLEKLSKIVNFITDILEALFHKNSSPIL